MLPPDTLRVTYRTFVEESTDANALEIVEAARRAGYTVRV
jgi:hypothetical protein